MQDVNKCAHLENLVEKIRNEKKINSIADAIKDMIEIQYELQKHIDKSKNINDMDSNKYQENFSYVMDFIRKQNLAIIDEFSELQNALGSEIWKWWKTKHYEIKDKRLTEIATEEELAELYFEIIDIAHFALNLIILAYKLIPEDNIDNFLNSRLNEIEALLNFFKSEENKELTVESYNFLIKKLGADIIEELGNIIKNSASNEEIISSSLNIILFLIKFFNKVSNKPYIDFYYYYVAKNYENINRQNRGY